MLPSAFFYSASPSNQRKGRARRWAVCVSRGYTVRLEATVHARATRGTDVFVHVALRTSPLRCWTRLTIRSRVHTSHARSAPGDNNCAARWTCGMEVPCDSVSGSVRRLLSLAQKLSNLAFHSTDAKFRSRFLDECACPSKVGRRPTVLVSLRSCKCTLTAEAGAASPLVLGELVACLEHVAT